MRSFIKKFFYAAKGLRYCFHSQSSCKVHLLATLFVLLLAYMLNISLLHLLILLLWIGAVWSAELMNTALELIIDKISPEWNETAGRAKDLAAASVLVLSIGAAISGLLKTNH